MCSFLPTLLDQRFGSGLMADAHRAARQGNNWMQRVRDQQSVQIQGVA